MMTLRITGQSSLEYLICLAMITASVAVAIDGPWSGMVHAAQEQFAQFSARLGRP